MQSSTLANESDLLQPQGHKGLELLIQECPTNPTSRVLDVGSGLGGPSRFFHHRTGARIYGIDIQGNYIEICRTLTQLSDKSQDLEYYQGDFMTYELLQDHFDAAFTITVALTYIPQYQAFEKVYKSLKPGGWFYIEDFYTLIEPEQL